MHWNSISYRVLFCLFSGIIPFTVAAQSYTTQLDSLLEALRKTGNHPTEEVVQLRNKIGRLYKQRNLKQALQFAEETLPIAEQANSPGSLTNAYSLVADLYNLTGDFKMGALYGDKTAKSMDGLTDSLSQAKKYIVLMNKGGWISPMISPEEKIKYGLKSLEIYTRHKSEPGMATACTELGTAYKNKALYHSRGNASDDSLDFKKAREYFHRAAAYNRKVKNIPQLAYCITIEAMMEKQLGLLGKAYRLNKTAIKLYNQEGCLLGAALPYSEISDIYYSEKHFDSAQWYIRKSISLYEQVGYKGNIDEFYDRLAKVYESMNNYQAALASLKQANDAREKKYSAETTRSILELENKYESKLKAEQIRALSTDKLLAEKSISQNRIIFWGIVLFLLLSAIGLFAYLRQRQKALIQQQSAASHHEKERISQDLHDNIGSQLATVTLGLNKLIKDNKLDSAQVCHLHETLSATIVELRDTIWAINKEEVTLEEMADKIKNLFWRIGKSDSQMKCQLRIPKEHLQEKLTPSQAINVFRIIQESIHNSIKHSEADEVSVSIESGPSRRICVSITDNGIGFNSNAVMESGHYGLSNMKKRAHEIQGAVEVISSPGSGTVIHLSFAVDKGYYHAKVKIRTDETAYVSAVG